MASIPRPDPHALELSAALTARLREEIEHAGGWLDFERYMQRVLYEPGLGYYSAGSRKFGSEGDFVTGPELGGLLAETLARQVAPMLAVLETPIIVEFGAGTGRLAWTLLRALEGMRCTPRYRIVEPSADLAERQRELLAPFGERVEWLGRWPGEPFSGVVLANEVLDALPVRRFVKRGAATRALGVAWGGNGFVWAEAAADRRLAAGVLALERKLGRTLEDGYCSEICLALPAWFATVAEPLQHGAALILDYGVVRREYYHPDRTAGTLVCHYRHRAHADPFLYPGLQDVSAWVDFSAAADAARAAGFRLGGFTTQGQFLLESGAHELAGAGAEPVLARARELATLVLPGQMGERFKLMQLTRGGLEGPPLPGRDFRDRL